MPDSTTAAQREQARQQTWISGLVALPFQLFGVLSASLLLAILMEWGGMFFFWSDQSWHHADQMLSHELNLLSSDFRKSVVIDAPLQTARQLIAWAHEHVVVRSGLGKWMESSRYALEQSRPGFTSLLKDAYRSLEPYVLAAGYTALTFLARVVVLCLMLPLSLTAAFVGLIDGLVRRDLRRFGAGRESGFLHHRARALTLPLAVLPWVVYLAVPVSVHPLWIVLPAAMLLSIAVNIAAGSFKKYL